MHAVAINDTKSDSLVATSELFFYSDRNIHGGEIILKGIPYMP